MQAFKGIRLCDPNVVLLEWHRPRVRVRYRFLCYVKVRTRLRQIGIFGEAEDIETSLEGVVGEEETCRLGLWLVQFCPSCTALNRGEGKAW